MPDVFTVFLNNDDDDDVNDDDVPSDYNRVRPPPPPSFHLTMKNSKTVQKPLYQSFKNKPITRSVTLLITGDSQISNQ